MQKIKNKNKIWLIIAASFVEIVFILQPIAAFAVADTYDSDLNVVPSGNNISISVRLITAGPLFTYASYVAPVAAVLDGDGNIIAPATPATCADSTPNPDSVIASGASPASGFCAGILQCNSATALDNIPYCTGGTGAGSCTAVNICAKAVANGYNKKIIDALKAATDAKIADNGLDKTKANDALAACGGDLSCINNVLATLQTDSSFSTSSTSSSDAPLTASSLSDLINSSKSTADTGPINSASNDLGGLLGKTPGPKVDVTFSSTSTTQVGAKMSAVAVPSFFNNASDPKQVYFTWYLKRKNCGLTNSSDPGDVNVCDMDGNGKITENDWKIAAAKIIVAGSFDRTEADYTKSIDSGIAGYKATPSPIGEWSINSGKDTNDPSAPNCYVQAPSSGRIYELRKVKSIFDSTCSSGYHRACVSNQTADCKVFNNIDPTYTEKFNACAVSSEKSDNSDAICSVKDDAALKNFKATVACTASNNTPICVKDDNVSTEFKDGFNNVLGIIVGTEPGSENDTANKNKICSAVAKPDLSNSTSTTNFFLSNADPRVANASCSTVTDELINGTKDSKGNTLVAGNINLTPKCSFEKNVNLCQHLFPEVPDAVTGDGKFTLAEKKFWGADPTKASTSGNGATDEQNVTGLGIDHFDWMFTPGDQVGVVVEGDSAFQSDHPNDASYQRMWAFSKGACKALDNMEKGSTIDPANPDKNTRGFYIDGKGILTADVDLNECLKDNLLDPSVDSSANLSVQLTASPANPTNDPNGRGDILNVVSSAANTQDSIGLSYTWSVQENRDGSTAPIDTTEWVDITKTMESGGSFAETDVVGLGKKELAINLNMQDADILKGITDAKSYTGTFYLKIKVKIKGTAADGSQNADGMTIVRVKQQENAILVYPVTAGDTGTLSLNKGIAGQSLELCSDAQGKARSGCYVTKDQIVGLVIPSTTKTATTQFSWTVNGVAIACSGAISTECASGNVLFFPILGNEGEAVDVVAKGVDSINESIEISRHFVIIKPQVQIISMDYSSIWPKLLGYYKDLDGNKTPDYSSQVFETNSGKTMQFGAAVYSAWNQSNNFSWTVDGGIQGSNDTAGDQISVPVDKMVGDSYNIGLVLATAHTPAQDKQANNLRKALSQNWGVSPEDSIDTGDTSANIQVNIVDASSQALSKANQAGIFASLITHLPEQFMFLLEISLTAVLLIFSMGILFAIIPESLVTREKVF